MGHVGGWGLTAQVIELHLLVATIPRVAPVAVIDGIEFLELSETLLLL